MACKRKSLVISFSYLMEFVIIIWGHFCMELVDQSLMTSQFAGLIKNLTKMLPSKLLIWKNRKYLLLLILLFVCIFSCEIRVFLLVSNIPTPSESLCMYKKKKRERCLKHSWDDDCGILLFFNQFNLKPKRWPL